MVETLADKRAPLRQTLAACGILFASVCFGIVPYFSRSLTDQGLAPHAVAFYRYVIPAVTFAPTFLQQSHRWRELLWGITSGAVMGAGWIGYVHALETVPASTVGVLYMTYPVFTVLIALVLFADRPSKRALVACGMIVLAAGIAGNPSAFPASQLPTLLLSLGAPLGFGFAICVLVHRLAVLPPLARIGTVSLGAVLVLVPMMLASAPSDVLPKTATDWTLIAGIAVFSALVPQLLYVISSPIIGASRSAIIGSVELPVMFLVSVFAFGEPLGVAQLAACALIIAAIVLTGSRAARNVTTQIAQER